MRGRQSHVHIYGIGYDPDNIPVAILERRLVCERKQWHACRSELFGRDNKQSDDYDFGQYAGWGIWLSLGCDQRLWFRSYEPYYADGKQLLHASVAQHAL